MTLCWASSKDEALHTAKEMANALVSGEVSAELALPHHFEQITEDISADLMESVGRNGDNQLAFLEFAQSEILPRFA